MVDVPDMRGVYGRFLTNGTRRSATTMGLTGRRYLFEDELYVTYLERETGATPERRAELRTLTDWNARHNEAYSGATHTSE